MNRDSGMRCGITGVCVVLALTAVAEAGQFSRQKVEAPMSGTPSDHPIIVSPSVPKDSRGETVYEERGKSQDNEPVVPGVLIRPVPLKTPKVRYPKALKKEHKEGAVTLLGVVTENGELIDVRVEKTDDPLFSTSAVEAAQGYTFRPAQLKGKPVAMLIKFIIDFRLY